ncbi:MAG: 50S ribosomal protein L18 [Verrucomicrobia bacterium]|nr:MAG: 50S ribosomal protein L18 [Verrucomicrobiota bacterium]
MKVKTKQEFRQRRHFRVRGKVAGTAAKPRMSVYVSNRHIYVQFVDDVAGKTLVATSSAALGDVKLTLAMAKQLGQAAAVAAKAKGIEQVVFDRGGFAYKARLKALADAAREAGLKF